MGTSALRRYSISWMTHFNTFISPSILRTWPGAVAELVSMKTINGWELAGAMPRHGVHFWAWAMAHAVP